MSLKKNLLYNFILSFSQVAFPLISIPYITRVLDPVGIGKVGFVDSLTYYFIVIAEFGIATYGIREVARKKDRPEELKRLVSELVSLHVFTSVVSLSIFIGLLTVLYHKIDDIRLVLFSISFLLVNSFAAEWYFWGTENFKYITIRSLVTRVLGLASIFILVKRPDDYFIYYGIIVGTAIANLVLNFSRLISEVDVSFRNIQWKRHLSVISVTYKISLVYSVVLMLDNVFLQLLSTSVAVAYYMFAAKVVRISCALISDTLLVFYPHTVYQVYKNDDESLQATVFRSAQLIILATVPMAGGIFLLAEKITSVYFGNMFLPLATDLKILSLYPFLKSFSLFLNKQVLMPFDNEKYVLKGLVMGAIAFVCATIPLSYFFADKGTSAAVVISEMFVLLANLYYIKKMGSGIKMFDWKCVWQAFAGILLFVPIILIINSVGLGLVFQLVATILICAISYFIFLTIAGNELILVLLRSVKAIILPNSLKNGLQEN